ncbi:class I SAM-dependent methyltransferase [Lutimaribacter marinistellae]|uniref:Class I SAM-dependent methyltransferase n=1 Tax=Lutimaribacter marinistellae TaxID=1820329 RepID=A0ABV7TBB1_9RHOB
MKPDAAFWDGIADRYAARPIDDPDAYQYTLERTRAYLGANDSVLELGCGTGSTALLLSPQTGRYVASDISHRMIEIGQEKARQQGESHVEFTTADLHDAQFAGAHFDAVLALNLLHLVRDLPGALARIHDMLESGGLFISKTVCTPGPGAPFKYRLMRLLIPVMQMLGKAPYVNIRPVAEFEEMLTQAGFKIVESGDHPPPSRYIVARRV